MNANEDPDWEAEAKRAEIHEKWDACTRKIQKSHVLDVTTLRPGTRLVVTTFREDVDPVEFTILDPTTCKVLVKDGSNFREPREGTLLGSEDNQAITPGTSYPCKRVLLPGKLKLLCWLLYDVGGKKFDAGPDTIMRIEIFEPGMTKPYVLWND